jgi:hypothetical protein
VSLFIISLIASTEENSTLAVASVTISTVDIFSSAVDTSTTILSLSKFYFLKQLIKIPELYKATFK